MIENRISHMPYRIGQNFLAHSENLLNFIRGYVDEDRNNALLIVRISISGDQLMLPWYGVVCI